MNNLLRIVLGVGFGMFLFASCEKDSNEVEGVSTLSFVVSSIPDNNLSTDGGTFNLEIEWAYVKWIVRAGEAVKGQKFITEIRPSYGGSEDVDNTRSTVTVTYTFNNTTIVNQQQLILKTITAPSCQNAYL